MMIFAFVDEIRKSAGNAGIKTFTSKLDQGLMTDAIARGEADSTFSTVEAAAPEGHFGSWFWFEIIFN